MRRCSEDDKHVFATRQLRLRPPGGGAQFGEAAAPMRERAGASVREVASAFAPQRGRAPARLQLLGLRESLGTRLRVALRLGMRRPCPRFCGVSVFDSSLSF